MVNLILLVSFIIIICVIANQLSHKIGLPSLLLFLIIGMLFGSDGVFKIYFDNFYLSDIICTIALIFIMFYGGFGINIKSAKPVIGKAVVLSTAGVFLTTIITGLLCHLLLGFSLLEGMLIGAVIGSTDAASVFSILRSKQLNLKSGLAPLLEIESGSNDPMSFMLTTIVLGLIANEGGAPVYLLVIKQIGFGVLFGVVIGLGFRFLFKKFKVDGSGMTSLILVAIALLSFSLPSILGGNGYLCAYIVGMILGNIKIENKIELVHFFDGVTHMMQMLLFFTLGLLAFPSKMLPIALPAVIIFLIITFIARPLSIAILMTPFKMPFKEQLFVSWSGLRGAASIAFAILTVIHPAQMSMDVYHIVFVVCILSVTFQGSLLPVIAKKLKLIDPSQNVLKTFNDYEEELHMSLIQSVVDENHPWRNLFLKEIQTSDDLLVVLIQRGREYLLPDGDTQVRDGDCVILCAPRFRKTEEVELIEIQADDHPKWIGKTLAEISEPNSLIVMIEKPEETIIPNGSTVIEENDRLITLFEHTL